jgi:hypothetical protein
VIVSTGLLKNSGTRWGCWRREDLDNEIEGKNESTEGRMIDSGETSMEKRNEAKSIEYCDRGSHSDKDLLNSEGSRVWIN